MRPRISATGLSKALCAAALLGTVLAPAAARAGSPALLRPYDGSNPFNCQLQQVGTGTAFPDPTAEPLCVEYDKTNQNVTGLGLIEFMLAEPSRVAVSSDNCFYFQRDHWTGSLSQGQSPELWHWDGGYFFDKGSGLGGVFFEHMRFGEQGTFWAFLQQVPEQLRPYFHPTGFGALLDLGQGPDPGCAAKVDTPAERAAIYSSSTAPSSPPSAGSTRPRCGAAPGPIKGRRLGPLTLGMSRDAVSRRLGPGSRSSDGDERYCLSGGGRLWVVYSHSRVAMLATTSRSSRIGAIHPGTSASRIRGLRSMPRTRVGSARVYEASRGRSRRALVSVLRGRVRYVAIADPRVRSPERRLRISGKERPHG